MRLVFANSSPFELEFVSPHLVLGIRGGWMDIWLVIKLGVMPVSPRGGILSIIKNVFH